MPGKTYTQYIHKHTLFIKSITWLNHESVMQVKITDTINW